MAKERGFTLIELIVALAIFAVLSAASWQVVDRVAAARVAVEARSMELRQLQKGIWLLSQDLRAVANRPIRDNHGAVEPAFSSVVPGFVITFTRHGWPNPLELPRSSLQRVAYGIESGDRGDTALVRYYWPVLDRAPETQPVRQILIDGVQSMEVQFIDDRGNTHFYWPPGQDGDESRIEEAIPAGISARLTIDGFGELERVIQLRDRTLGS